jgi:hypothetical protein
MLLNCSALENPASSFAVNTVRSIFGSEDDLVRVQCHVTSPPANDEFE